MTGSSRLRRRARSAEAAASAAKAGGGGRVAAKARFLLALAIAAGAARAAPGGASNSGGGDFVRLPRPGPTEWRSVYPEPVQTLREYEDAAGRAPPFQERRILLVPLGPAAEGEDASLARLAAFLGAYYMTRVEVEAPMEVPDDLPRRMSYGYGRQILADAVLRELAVGLPEGAVARVAVTTDDLYARAPSGGNVSWVFGMGDPGTRTAVCSRARFSWHYPGEPEAATAETRLFKLAAHEVGHIFGLAHCQRYACGMNGSNSLQESDRAPFHLCPDCLAKIEGHLGFDRVQRYRALERVYRELGWPAEAEFAAKRARAEAATGDPGPGGERPRPSPGRRAEHPKQEGRPAR